VSIPHPIQLGPLGISAIPGKVMVWGYTSSRPDGYHPVANVLPAAGLPIMLTPEVGGQEKAWGYAGLLLADGRALLAMTTLIGEQSGNPLTGLYYSLDGGPMQPLVESGTVAWAAAWAFQSAAGEVSVFYYDDYHQTLWVGQAGETLDGDVTTVDSWITGHYCNAGTADGTNAHLLGQADAMAGEDGCYYGRVPLAGGAMNITEQVPLAQTWFISDRWEATAIATASDGTVWALWGLSCDQGRCTVLARRTPDGTWYGPYLPSHVTGAAAMAVDAAGRVHLVYSPVPVEGNRDLAPVYHTMLEVVQ
jgi:hypothetical protein